MEPIFTLRWMMQLENVAPWAWRSAWICFEVLPPPFKQSFSSILCQFSSCRQIHRYWLQSRGPHGLLDNIGNRGHKVIIFFGDGLVAFMLTLFGYYLLSYLLRKLSAFPCDSHSVKTSLIFKDLWYIVWITCKGTNTFGHICKILFSFITLQTQKCTKCDIQL